MPATQNKCFLLTKAQLSNLKLMKTIILYGSKYGAAKQYAEWIAEALNTKALNVFAVKPKELCSYEQIIFGGSLYACSVYGLKKALQKANPSKWIFFTCGIADPTAEENIKNLRSSVLSKLPEELKNVPIFHLRGNLDYSKLSFLHRIMMLAPIKAIEKKPLAQRTEEECQMLASYGKTANFMDKSAVLPIIQAAKEIS